MILDHIVTVPSYTYSTLISLTDFLAGKKCVFVTLHAGSAVTRFFFFFFFFFFWTNRNFIFIENMYGSVIRQAKIDIDSGLHFLGIRILNFLYDVIILLLYCQMKPM